MIYIDCEQGTEDWFKARAGACTASRFTIATSTTGGLDEKQQAYFDAIRAGRTPAEAMERAGYKAAPKSDTLKRALAGEKVEKPSDAAVKYAALLACERIAGAPLDDTFTTWAMRRGHELEPIARQLYMATSGYIVDEAGLVLTDDRMFGYSTDGVVYGHKGRIEVKCPVAGDKVAGIWMNPSEFTAEYRDQIDGGMWLTGCEWIDLVVYTPWLASVGRELYVQRFHRDEGRILQLEEGLTRFLGLTREIERRLRTPVEQREEVAA